MNKSIVLLTTSLFIVSNIFANDDLSDFYVRVGGGASTVSNSKINNNEIDKIFKLLQIPKRGGEVEVTENDNVKNDLSSKRFSNIFNKINLKSKTAKMFYIASGKEISNNVAVELELSYSASKLKSSKLNTLEQIYGNEYKPLKFMGANFVNNTWNLSHKANDQLTENLHFIVNAKHKGISLTTDQADRILTNVPHDEISHFTYVPQKIGSRKERLYKPEKKINLVNLSTLGIGTSYKYNVSTISLLANLVYKYNLTKATQLRTTLGAGVAKVSIKSTEVLSINNILVYNNSENSKRILPTISLGAGVAFAANSKVAIVPMYKYNMIFGKIKGLKLNSHNTSIGLEVRF